MISLTINTPSKLIYSHISLIAVFKNSLSCNFSSISAPSTARLHSPFFMNPSAGVYNSSILSTMKSLNVPDNVSISIFTICMTCPTQASIGSFGNSGYPLLDCQKQTIHDFPVTTFPQSSYVVTTIGSGSTTVAAVVTIGFSLYSSPLKFVLSTILDLNFKQRND